MTVPSESSKAFVFYLIPPLSAGDGFLFQNGLWLPYLAEVGAEANHLHRTLRRFMGPRVLSPMERSPSENKATTRLSSLMGAPYKQKKPRVRSRLLVQSTSITGPKHDAKVRRLRRRLTTPTTETGETAKISPGHTTKEQPGFCIHLHFDIRMCSSCRRVHKSIFSDSPRSRQDHGQEIALSRIRLEA